MSLVMALLLSAYILLCAGLAYLGDLLGRRMGKKRITILKLRPRHTAIIITSCIGALIALSSIYIMITVNKEFRQLVTNGYDTIQQFYETSAKLKEKNAQLERISQDLAKKGSMLDKAVLNLNAQQAQLNTAKQKLNQTNLELVRVSNALSKEKTAVRGLIATKIRLDHDIKRSVQIVIRQDETIRQQKQESERIKTQNDTYLAQNNELTEQNLLLSKNNTELSKINEKISSQNAMLVSDNKSLTSENMLLLNEKSKLSSDVEKYKAFLADTYASLRESRIAYQAKEEVSRRVVIGGLPIEQARWEVRQLLASARQSASERCEIPVEKAVFIPDKKMPDGSIVDEQKSIEAIAEQIANSPNDVVLVAVALVNTVSDEPVPIEIKPYRSKRIFNQGDEVAKITLDPKHSSADIFDQLISFLRKDVRTRAVQAGLIPIQQYDGAFAPIGQIDSSEVLRLLEKIKGLRTPVTIRAIATENTYSGGPLRLDFKIVAR